MKKWEKYTGYFLLAITSLIIILFLILGLARNFLLRQAIHYANKNLLIKIDFQRSRVSVLKTYPLAVFHFYNLTITGKGTFEKDTLLYVPDIKITINLDSVAKRKNIFLVKEIDGTNPELRLVYTREGIGNYYFFPSKEEITTTTKPFYILVKTLNIFRGRVSYNDYESQVFINSNNVVANFSNLKMSQESAEFYLSAFFEDVSLKYHKAYLIKDIDLSIESNYKNIFPGCTDNYYFNGSFGINQLSFSAKGVFENYNVCDSPYFHNYNLEIHALTNNFKDLLSVVNIFYRSKDFDKIKSSGKYHIDLKYLSKYTSNIDTTNLTANLEITKGYAYLPQINETLKDLNLRAAIQYSDFLRVRINQATFNINDNNFYLGNLLIINKYKKLYINGLLNTNIDLSHLNKLSLTKRYNINGNLKAHILISGYLDKQKINSLTNLSISGFSILKNFSISTQKFNLTSPLIGTYISKRQIFITTDKALINGTALSTKISFTNYIPYLLTRKDSLTQPLFIKSQTHINTLDLNKLSAQTQPASPILLPVLPFDHWNATISLSIDRLIYKSLVFKQIKTFSYLYPDSVYIKSLQFSLSSSLVNSMAHISFLGNEALVTFGSDIMNINPGYLPQWFDLNDSISNLFANTSGTLDMGLSGSFLFHPQAGKKFEKIYITGKLLTDNLQLPNNPVTNRLAKFLDIPTLKTPTIQDLSLYFRLQHGSVLIPRSEFILSGRKASLDGYYATKSNIINLTLGLTMSKQEILRLLHKTFTGENQTFIYIKLIGDAADPKIRLSANLFKKSTTANIQNQSLQTKALTDSIRAAKIVERQKKKQNISEAKQLIKQTRQRTRLIMRKAREISRQLQKQNTPEARKKARQVIRNARKMRKSLIKRATNFKKIEKHKQKSKIDTLNVKYRKLRKKLRKIIIN